MRPVVFISGSRRGLGYAIAKEYASHGYDIILNDFQDLNLLQKNKEWIERTYDSKVLICYGDVSLENDVIRMLNEVKEEFGRLDVLVNNAAIVEDMELEDRNLELFENTIRNNVSGVYLMCKYFGKYMYDIHELSRIINISSTNGIDCNFPTSIDYDASKAAVISLTKNFAIQYAPKVLVNSVAPGWINTEMNADLPDDLIEEETSKIYLHRFAEPKEIAKLVFFLGSEENTYINNEIIKIDGGY